MNDIQCLPAKKCIRKSRFDWVLCKFGRNVLLLQVGEYELQKTGGNFTCPSDDKN